MKNFGAEKPEYIVHGKDIMAKFKALQSAIELYSKNLKPQNDALDDALDDALESKLLMLLKEYPNLTQKEMGERISVSRATVQRLVKKLVVEKN